MKTFDAQNIEIRAPVGKVFDYVAKAKNLPAWTNAFKNTAPGRATLQTPNGIVEIGLEVNASRERCTIDWVLTFPDGTEAKAYSRVIPLGADRSVYSFVLLPPPVPLEKLEGALEEQSGILREELAKLASIIGNR